MPLGIPASDSDVLPLLADAVSKRKGDAATYGEAINKLVDGILAGPSPSELVNKALPLVEIGSGKTASPYDDPAWKWGTPTARRAVEETIWSLAQAARDRNPGRSSDLARASLMLSAMSDIEDSWSGLSWVVDDPDTARKLLNIPEDRFKSLSAAIKTRIDQDHINFTEGLAAAKATDAINSENAGAVTLGEVNGVLAHMDTEFRKGVPQLFDQCGTIYSAWLLLNTVRYKGSPETTAAVEAQLRKWQEDYPDPNLKRWISEALSRQGLPPGKLVGTFEAVPGSRQLKAIPPNDPRLSPQPPSTQP